MRAIEELMQEHRAIEVVLTGLEHMAQRAKDDGQVNQGRADKVLEILRHFADRCHHAKEERNLFQLMAERGVPREGGPLEAMLHEHEQGRHHLETMARVSPGASRGDTEALLVFAEHARSYARLLRQHIGKEDKILYPMAEQVLTAEDDERLMEAFEAIEREEMGEGAHEKYHRWAHESAERRD
ncbi:MAG: hemerythrin domain-containing protein [Armatimonadetes bacterium]|nr:hemerythrin domain-containing protein [Armatimonadota bacterium]